MPPLFGLSISMGIPGEFQSQAFQDAMSRVADVADRYGKSAGVAAGSVAMAEEWKWREEADRSCSSLHRNGEGLGEGLLPVRQS